MRLLTSHPRGNSLLMTLIALAVLMMLVAAAIQFTGTNREAAISKARADELQACATTGRKLLLSQLRTLGPTLGGGAASLTLDTKLPDTQLTTTDKVLRSGHYDNTAVEPVIVKLDSKAMGASRNQVREMANTLPDSTTLGGSYFRVIVTCKNPSSNAQSEVEFTFRHGL